jgi:glycosyltransferase involved in cell wall biosynthesis
MNGVSIVLCCHNSANRLPETLAHLANQKATEDMPWEVIVVDNASTDETARVTRESWSADGPAPLFVVTERQLGLSHARNRGLSEAHYEYVSFIDDDNWVAPNWVQTTFEVMKLHPDVGACGGVAEGVYEVEPPKWFHRYAGFYAIGEQGEPGDITWARGVLWGAGMTVRKSAWQMLVGNGFQQGLTDRIGTHLTSGGDNELCLALRLAGWRIWYEPRLSIRHLMPTQRLQWQYFRRLYRAAGASAVSYDRYLRALEPLPDNLRERAKQRWWGQALLISRELALNPRRWLHMVRNPAEGDDDVLWLDWRIGRLRELTRQRANYDRSITTVRQAPWRRSAEQVIRPSTLDVTDNVDYQVCSRESLPAQIQGIPRDEGLNKSMQAQPQREDKRVPPRRLRVAINAQLSGSGVAGGVEQAVAGLLYGLGRLEDGDEEYVAVCAPGKRAWLERLAGPNTRIVERPLPSVDRTALCLTRIPAFQPVFPVARFLWLNTTMRYRAWITGRLQHATNADKTFAPSPGVLGQIGADVVHFPYQLMERVDAPSIFTPWDFQHEHHPEFFTPEMLSWRRSYYPAACRAASVVIAGTPTVRQDISQFAGVGQEKVFLAPWGNPIQITASPPTNAALAAISARLELPQEFALYPAQTYPHKNHIRLLQALARLRDMQGITVHLVCTGGQNDHFAEIQREVRRLKLENQIRFIGFVDSSELRALYKLAAFVVFPSLFEGWGFPPVEALSEGTALTCSDIQPLTERVGAAALLFDPMSVESIADAVRRLALDHEFRTVLSRRGIEYGRRHSWESCARTHRALYRLLGGVQLTEHDRQLLEAAQQDVLPVRSPTYTEEFSTSQAEHH